MGTWGDSRALTMPESKDTDWGAAPPTYQNLHGQENAPETASSKKLVTNFIIMSVCFSINHATVTAMVGLASANLGSETGNLQTALLYSFYTLTALIAAKSIVSRTGDKWGIIFGLALYVVYVASFIVADKVSSIRKFSACLGGSIGGVAAGFLWTAQFSYFGKNAALYAQANREALLQDKPDDVGNDEASIKAYINGKAGDTFAAWFAIPYLGFEVLFKLLQSYIGSTTSAVNAGWSDGKDFIYVINTICAVVAACGCYFIMDLPDPVPEPDSEAASKPQSPPSTLEKLTEAGKLFVFDPKMSMMCGMNICFGISAAYMNGMVTGPVVTYYLGSGYGGYLLSLTAVIAAMVSVPNTLKLVPASSKPYFMIVGPACFALIGLLPLLSGYDGWLGGKGLLVLYVLQGVGRGVWEATNKACFLSYFGHVKDKGVIGSNIIIQNGGASAIAFFMNAYSDASPKLSDCQAAGNCPVYAQEAWAVLVFSLLAIVGFLGASVLHSKDVHTWSGALGVAKNEEESNELSTQFK